MTTDTIHLTTERTPQTSLILRHLREHESISPIEALAVYRVHRLAARIQDLRMAGHKIDTVIRKDAVGKRYARYSLAS